MDFEFGERLNVLTGDNGLGKSFVLDLVWWGMSGSWAGQSVLPRGESPTIRTVRAGPNFSGSVRAEAEFVYADQRWSWTRARTNVQGPVVYLATDRIFVFDPYRNSASLNSERPEPSPYPDAFRFGWPELWDGIEYEGRQVCNGLVRDWVTWMRSRAESEGHRPVPFELLESVLDSLSPSETERLKAGPPRRVFGEARELPTLENHHGSDDVPVVLAAAGFRRILALAYVLVWTWVEHRQAAELKHIEPRRQMSLLIDEVEMHLHPQWQRRILPALITVVEQLDPAMKVQLFCTSHSPLVLASIESIVDKERDKLFNFELRDGGVVVDELPWVKHGDASGWLASEVFSTPPYGNRSAEQAIRWAEDYMIGEFDEIPEQLRSREALDAELRRVLAASDPFWIRWYVRDEDVAE